MATYTAAEYKRKLDRWLRTLGSDVEEAMQKAAEVVRREVLMGHLSGPRMAKGRGSKTRATLARVTGDLAGSIRAYTDRTGSRIRGFVGTGVVYAAVHEFGYPPRGIPERSYLRSSLKTKQKDVLRVLLKGVMDSYKETQP